MAQVTYFPDLLAADDSVFLLPELLRPRRLLLPLDVAALRLHALGDEGSTLGFVGAFEDGV